MVLVVEGRKYNQVPWFDKIPPPIQALVLKCLDFGITKAMSQKVQVPNVSDLRSQKPIMVWVLGQQTFNIGHLDPLGVLSWSFPKSLFRSGGGDARTLQPQASRSLLTHGPRDKICFIPGAPTDQGRSSCTCIHVCRIIWPRRRYYSCTWSFGVSTELTASSSPGRWLQQARAVAQEGRAWPCRVHCRFRASIRQVGASINMATLWKCRS